MKKLTNYEKGYLEGLIDGEGCISLYQNKCKKGGNAIVRGEVCITNTNFDLIKKIQKILGKENYCMYLKKQTNKKWANCYFIKFTSKGIREILPQLKLVIKEKKRKIVIRVMKILLKRKGGFGTWNQNYKSKELLTHLATFKKL